MLIIILLFQIKEEEVYGVLEKRGKVKWSQRYCTIYTLKEIGDTITHSPYYLSCYKNRKDNIPVNVIELRFISSPHLHHYPHNQLLYLFHYRYNNMNESMKIISYFIKIIIIILRKKQTSEKYIIKISYIFQLLMVL
jgi:hypothetical protein